MKKVLVALCCVATLASCKKDESVAIAKADALVAHSWKLSKVESVINGIPVDVTSTMLTEACEKDDFETFAKDNKWTADNGATKCNEGDAQTKTGTWVLSENDTKLKVTETANPDNADNYTVGTLDASTMVLTQTESLAGISVTLRRTYVKK
jgi:hypothetical protein